MPEHARPRTNEARIAFLQSAEQRERCQNLLLPDLAAALTTCHQRMGTLYFREIDMEAERMRLCAERKSAFARLSQLIRHYWQTLRLQVRRGELPKEAFIHVSLNQLGRNLRLVRMGEKLTAARSLLAGATTMESMGWQLHQEPGADEIAAALEHVRTVMKAHDSHVTGLLALRKTMKAEAARADLVYHQVYHSVRAALHGRRPAEKRVTLRQYGIIFRYRPDRDRAHLKEKPKTAASTTNETIYENRAPMTPDEIGEVRDRQTLGHILPMPAKVEPAGRPPTVEVPRKEREQRRRRIRQMLRRLKRHKPRRHLKRRPPLEPAA